MKTLKHILVSLSGIIGLSITVATVSIIDIFTQFNLFTLSYFFIIPVGAIITGFAAASFYFISSIYLNVKPNTITLTQIIIASAIAQIAIYYAEYSFMKFDDGSALSNYVGFQGYLTTYLQQSHLLIGRVGHDAGELGELGLWIALIQYIGFLIGGLTVYQFLITHPSCAECSLYLRKLAVKDQKFTVIENFEAYYDAIFKCQLDGDEFKDLLNWSPRTEKAKRGDVNVKTKLHGCPNCKRQLIAQGVSVLAKNGWRDVQELKRYLHVPDNVSVLNAFKQQTTSSS